MKPLHSAERRLARTGSSKERHENAASTEMTIPKVDASERHGVQELANRIDVLCRELDDGAPFMIVDALAEAWRRGLPNAIGEAAIVLSARRGTSIVCCPLGRPDPTAVILPNDVAVGMSAEQVRNLIGEPDHETIVGDEATWLHALPFAARDDDESDGTEYKSRQAAWPRNDASPDDPPFAPLTAGERLFRVTAFARDRVIGGSVTVGCGIKSVQGR